MGYSFIDNVKKEGGSDKTKNNVSFLPVKPEWTLDEVIFSKQLKEQLSDITSFCKNKDKIIDEWELYRFMKGKGCIGINFWGIPGTGKSIAAEAIASALDMNIIQASYSSLMDSLQGNTEKNITALFDTAVKENCVILFDEADGLLSARKSGGANAETTNLIKSHLLNILDRSTAIVIFTTNFFKSYDRAFVRRILWNVEIPAPGIEELTDIWKLHLGKNVPKDVEYSELAQITFDLAKEKSISITGGDVRKLTLMFCTQLTAGRYSSITEDVVRTVVGKYLNDLQESNLSKTTEVPASEVPNKVKDELTNN